MSRGFVGIGLVGAAVAAGALVFAQRSCEPEPFTPPAETPPVVERPEAEVNEGRPTGVRPGGIIPRVLGPKPVVVVREVTTTRPDSALSRRYGALATRFAKYRDSVEQMERGELVLPPGRQLEPPPVILPPVAGNYDGKTLRLWLTQSDGNVMRATARVRPRITFRAGQGDFTDSLPFISGDRWIVRQAREAADCAPESVVLGLLAALVSKPEDRLRNGVAVAGSSEVVCLVAD